MYLTDGSFQNINIFQFWNQGIFSLQTLISVEENQVFVIPISYIHNISYINLFLSVKTGKTGN